MSENNQWSITFRYVVGILLFAVFTAFVFYARDAVRNFVLAGFVAYLLNPAVDFLASRSKLKRIASVNIVFFSSVILLVAIVAAIALTLRHRPGTRYQKIEEQVAVRREDRVRMVKMDAEERR